MRSAILAGACALAGSAALAQPFPTKPSNLVVPNPRGGIVDTSDRLVADSLAKVLGQASTKIRAS